MNTATAQKFSTHYTPGFDTNALSKTNPMLMHLVHKHEITTPKYEISISEIPDGIRLTVFVKPRANGKYREVIEKLDDSVTKEVFSKIENEIIDPLVAALFQEEFIHDGPVYLHLVYSKEKNTIYLVNIF